MSIAQTYVDRLRFGAKESASPAASPITVAVSASPQARAVSSD
jgi:hypothetical protein